MRYLLLTLTLVLSACANTGNEALSEEDSELRPDQCPDSWDGQWAELREDHPCYKTPRELRAESRDDTG